MKSKNESCPCCTAGGDPFKPSSTLLIALARELVDTEQFACSTHSEALVSFRAMHRHPEIKAWIETMIELGYVTR